MKCAISPPTDFRPGEVPIGSTRWFGRSRLWR